MCDLSALRPWEMTDERFDLAWWLELRAARAAYDDGRQRAIEKRASHQQATANAQARAQQSAGVRRRR